ncbi:hypothetical protein [Paenibacillus sp. PAMC 26794]|uniref:hypothetical protein n=1 Tax=Paenibacillus sp. PAMC 26794 TaxID=1257080 RepID=UPI00037169A4|nr:hypothetical protein [Paenibacillus sp. PAMC 26794]
MCVKRLQRPANYSGTFHDEQGRMNGYDVRGPFVEIYKDRVVVKGRDFVAGEWIEGVEFTVRYPVEG